MPNRDRAATGTLTCTLNCSQTSIILQRGRANVQSLTAWALAATMLAIMASFCATPALAQISDGVVRIGVINDQTGVYADLGGPGSAEAARMAIEDAGGKVLGKPVELLVADHLNKADVGVGIARRWFDVEKAD